MTRPYTPTEERLLDLLSDGDAHTKDELQGCLSDELAASGTLRQVVSRLRAKLKARGEDIVCVIITGRLRGYRQVRVLSNPYDGRH